MRLLGIAAAGIPDIDELILISTVHMLSATRVTRSLVVIDWFIEVEELEALGTTLIVELIMSIPFKMSLPVCCCSRAEAEREDEEVC